ncbi:MAG: hypothetical protein B7733_14700 [Myxococcales bacterium FL481]|nr:MAG: hypothetical protein B7733_14700 [Myxococcales bacterium FL481]
MDAHPRYGVAELLREAADVIEVHPERQEEIAMLLDVVADAVRTHGAAESRKQFERAVALLCRLRVEQSGVRSRVRT